MCTSYSPAQGMQPVGIVMRGMGTRVMSAIALIAAIVAPALAHTRVRSDATSGQSSPHSALFADCTDAAIREVRLPYRAKVDQIRVLLKDAPSGSDEESPVLVEVSTGRSARRLWAQGAPGRALRFSPGLESDRFQVTLDPSFAGAASACVARVDLVSDGLVVASITP
jgi:hypothetical protein